MSGGEGPLVILTGFMGAGKSTVGRAVAARLGVDFLDTDAELERDTGRTIADIFATDGEAVFRALELDTVGRVLHDFGGVVALGGGSVTVPGIRDALAGHLVVHLRISPEAGFARVDGSGRPLLAGDDPRGAYARLLAERTDVYEAVAAADVDADQPVDAVVTAVLAELTGGAEPARKDDQS